MHLAAKALLAKPYYATWLSPLPSISDFVERCGQNNTSVVSAVLHSGLATWTAVFPLRFLDHPLNILEDLILLFLTLRLAGLNFGLQVRDSPTQF